MCLFAQNIQLNRSIFISNRARSLFKCIHQLCILLIFHKRFKFTNLSFPCVSVKLSKCQLNHLRIQHSNYVISIWKHWVNRFECCLHTEASNLKIFALNLAIGRRLSQVCIFRKFLNLILWNHIKQLIKFPRYADGSDADSRSRRSACIPK